MSDSFTKDLISILDLHQRAARFKKEIDELEAQARFVSATQPKLDRVNGEPV